MSASMFLDDREVEFVRRLLDRSQLSPPDLAIAIDLLQRLPESEAVPSCGPDSAPGSLSPQESGRRFSIIPLTPRAVPMVDAIDRVLARLPHSGDSV